ncbi:MAG TPA: alpha-1,4-glucan--maltose-1-phosphate maltosyltransferase [Gemmatimonadaceae bacterium]|nr:alpha-1,4-glucan--maltose-1-phosphate maltosyltransferase [Gemmatimonadaceae bacterium]
MTRRRIEKSSGRAQTPSALARLAIECVSPVLDDGRFPVKRIIGETLRVGADIFKDGHDLLAARVRYRAPGENDWRYAPMTFDYNSDRWLGSFPLDQIGRWTYTVEAWTDQFGTWRSELEKKLNAGHDVSIELLEGAELVEAAARRTRFGEARTALKQTAILLRNGSVDMHTRANSALAPGLLTLVEMNLGPRDLTGYDRELSVVVDRERARFASWYEMFPRSQTDNPARHATFADAEKALPRLAELGFDVIYLPPIHPIGLTARKGPNNSLAAGPNDPGSPWAIGSEAGGHTAVDPRLGTIADFERFVQTAHRLGMEVALDYALQCSPDHPWLKEHPEWFFIRPDGSIKYAENPPKKYQDIYPLNFWCEDRAALWNACLGIFLFWIARGVRTFRVDNPHTKPFAFWEWAIARVQSEHPDVIFLSEAFTRPKRMKYLAKLGFTQSYTYFTWRNTASELREYLTELTTPPVAEYMRGNLFANTPDILHEYLQHGGRPAFRIRLLLAATLSPIYGIYSGFELGENVPVRRGSEEYLDSEKYQLRPRDWNAPGNINDDIARINRIRRENRALQLNANLTFHTSENDQILFYRKSAPNRTNDLLIAVNVDPHRPHETMVHVPLDDLQLRPDQPYVVEDLLTGTRYTWRGARNYVRLDPHAHPAHILRLVRPAT